VITTRNDGQFSTLDAVHQTVGFIDTTRPETDQIFPQGFWLANPFERMAKAIFNVE
jgi:hypothetical protein